MRGDDLDRHDSDHEPCSTGGGSVTAPQRPPPPPQGVTKKPSQPEHSPLRLALSAKTPPLTSATPLLTASLNRPPVIVSTSGIDLSKRGGAVNSKQITSSLSQQLQQPNDNNSRSISAELYANLLMQLRRASDVASAANDASPAFKLTAAARKERLKYQPCFQCPVCKKRFQRHIAMNAHFQNEHIGQTSSADVDKKVCRLCSFVAVDIIAVRQHLVKQHNIDLENPSACLVEPEPTSSTSPFSGDLIMSRSSSGMSSPPVTIRAISSSPVTINDSSVDLITSSSVSPDRTSPVSIVKIEQFEDHQADDQDQAKDLSIRGQQLQKQHQQRNQPEPEVIHINSRKSGTSPNRKRPAATSPSPVRIVKRTCNNKNNNNNVQNDENDWQCRHCNITFPNQTLYFLHRGFHSDSNPWRCNGCGIKCSDMYDFNTHLVSDPHR